MNQRYPQSRHTPHGGSEKPTQRKVPACKRAEGGRGQWLPVATAPVAVGIGTQIHKIIDSGSVRILKIQDRLA